MVTYKFHQWYNRTGNHLVALLNLIHFAFIENNASKIEIPQHSLFKLRFNTNMEKDTKDLCYDNTVIDLTRRFNPCGNITITLDKMSYLFDKYIELKINDVGSSYYDICIHIRSGDIFKNLIHGNYVQPPLDYYIQIVENNPNSTICIVSENDNNPVLPFLKKYVYKNKYKNISFQQASLESDIMTLCRCRNLVFSFGTFCILPLLVSNTIKRVFIPKSAINMHWFKPVHQKIDISIIDFEKYFHKWHNSDEEIKLMMNYKLNNEDELLKICDM